MIKLGADILRATLDDGTRRGLALSNDPGAAREYAAPVAMTT